MKIIINRGFENILTRIVIFKNAQKVVVCPIKKDYCEFNVKKGDNIVIKLQYLKTFSLAVKSFIYHEEKETFYLYPTILCKIWELLNYRIFMGLCALFFELKEVIETKTCEWLFVGMFVFMVLSLLCFQFCMFIPFMRKNSLS